jgi:hypothetical protein
MSAIKEVVAARRLTCAEEAIRKELNRQEQDQPRSDLYIDDDTMFGDKVYVEGPVDLKALAGAVVNALYGGGK